jgi:hypothetical protein
LRKVVQFRVNLGGQIRKKQNELTNTHTDRERETNADIGERRETEEGETHEDKDRHMDTYKKSQEKGKRSRKQTTTRRSHLGAFIKLKVLLKATKAVAE